MKFRITSVAVLAAVAPFVAACSGADSTARPVSTQTSGQTAVPPTATPAALPTTPGIPPTSDSAPSTPGAAPSTSPAIPLAQEATLEIRATDAPHQKVTKILITVANIEVHKATGDGWVNVVQGPVEFDLVEFQGVEETLGEAILEPGRYGQIRLEIEKVLVTVDGNVLSARVPSGKLQIAGGFPLESGDTTILTLDFDAGKSVVVAGKRTVLIKPVIKLLARKADKALAATEEVAGSRRLPNHPRKLLLRPPP